MKPENVKQYYRPAELAEHLEESRQMIYRWIRRGKIRAIHHGRKLVICREEVQRLTSTGIQ